MAGGNKTRYPLLGLLTWGPASGYDLKQRIEVSLGNFWSESFGQIYPVLKQLESEGLVHADDAGGTGQRQRTVYALTDAGHDALHAWLAESPAPQQVRLEILLKLFFGRHVPPEVSRKHVLTVQGWHRRAVTRLEGKSRELSAGMTGHPDLPYWLLTIDYGLRQSRAVLDWCEGALAALPPAEDDSVPAPANPRST